MVINDVVWGSQEISDADAVKIINHSSFQRIRKIWISTYGYLYELKRNSTRYEHSIGVYLLLKHFNASHEEQIAGLIHDISHTAFSHVSTYAMKDTYDGEEFHEIVGKKFYVESGLSELLNSLGLDPDKLEDHKQHTLLENDLPDICADRIDYALRDGVHLQIITRQQVNKIIEGLAVVNGEFVFTNAESAFLYSFNFYLLNLLHYGSATEAHFNNVYASVMKEAIRKGILTEEDWFTDDPTVIAKLNNCNDAEIKEKLAAFNTNLVAHEDSENPDVVFPKKIRVVDPKVIINGKVSRLTEIDPVYAKLVNDYKATHQKHELPVKVMVK